MESSDGYADSSAEDTDIQPPSSLSDSASPPAGFSAWSEIPPEALIPGESFHDRGRMIFWLPLTHSAELSTKLIMRKSFVVKNLALRQGDTHLPTKPNASYFGNLTRLLLIFSGFRKSPASQLTGASNWSVLGFGRLIWKGFSQVGQGMIAILKRFVGGQ